MKKLFEEIKKSFSLLDLKEDWDEDGAKPPTEISFSKMLEFFGCLMSKNIDTNIEPNIFPCGDGSIDISFRIENDIRLLINISDERIGWYGDINGNPPIINGEQKDVFNDELFEWIKNNIK